MDARGPVTAQRVPMAAGMPGPVPHNMGANPPPPARPVRPTCHVFVCAGCCSNCYYEISFLHGTMHMKRYLIG